MHMYLSTSMSYTHFPHGRGMECQSTRLSVPAHSQPISSPWSPFWNNNQPPYWITSLSPNPAVYPSFCSKKKKKKKSKLNMSLVCPVIDKSTFFNPAATNYHIIRLTGISVGRPWPKSNKGYADCFCLLGQTVVKKTAKIRKVDMRRIAQKEAELLSSTVTVDQLQGIGSRRELAQLTSLMHKAGMRQWLSSYTCTV